MSYYVDIFWSHHGIFIPHKHLLKIPGDKGCMTSPKNVCLGGQLLVCGNHCQLGNNLGKLMNFCILFHVKTLNF